VVEAVQDLQALITRVERCVAVDPDDVVPVASHPNLWELRLNDHASGVHLRIYYAEVAELPHTVVALHAHAKFTDGTPSEIKQQQDEAISLAMLRFHAGVKGLWGLA
jgi:phage-related protein